MAQIFFCQKLRNGQLVTIPPILVRRLKSQFYAMPCGVDLILGLNGYIWVSKHVVEKEQAGEAGFDAEAVYSNKNDVRIFFYLRKIILNNYRDYFSLSTHPREKQFLASAILFGSSPNITCLLPIPSWWTRMNGLSIKTATSKTCYRTRLLRR